MGGEEGAVGGKGVGEGRADLLEGLGAGGGGGGRKTDCSPQPLTLLKDSLPITVRKGLASKGP